MYHKNQLNVGSLDIPYMDPMGIYPHEWLINLAEIFGKFDIWLINPTYLLDIYQFDHYNYFPKKTEGSTFPIVVYGCFQK